MSQRPPHAELREAFRRAGQEHVFRFWGELKEPERSALAAQLRGIDLDQLLRLAGGTGVVAPDQAAQHGAQAPVIRLGEEPSFATRKVAHAAGDQLLAKGKVGILLVAGGQGSRLGFDGPKGCLPVGPLSGKTLFQIHAEKIAALTAQHGTAIPWYIMVSEANAERTRAFFEENRHFGLSPSSVFYFQQAMMPALDDGGKLVLESKSRIFLSPNGHGGVYAAFRTSGALDHAESLGVEHIFYFQVDNVLIQMADPVFLGFHALSGSDMSLKLLRKTGPYEKLGVVVVEGGRHRIIEYSDLTKEEAERRGREGELVYWAGSPAIHAFHLPFFRRVAEEDIELPYHLARKAISTVDEKGRPAQVEGRKYEMFVFDALPYAERVLNLEVKREEEFAPVKNRTGEDSLESAQDLLVAEHRRWLREAGVTVAGKAEISPLAALGPEELRARIPAAAPREHERHVLVERGPTGEIELRPTP